MERSNDQQARAILDAIRAAQYELRRPGPAAKRAAAARSHFAAYTHTGPLAPHVRDVYYCAGGVRSVESAMGRLERLAYAFIEPKADAE